MCCISALLVLGVLLCSLLQWLSDFSNTFRLTNFLFCGHGFLHRSLLCTLAEEGDYATLEDILQALRIHHAGKVVSRADRNGDTPLHLACRRGFTYCAEALLRKDAKTRSFFFLLLKL